MRANLKKFIFSLVSYSAVGSSLVCGGQINESTVNRLGGLERWQLESLEALNGTNLQKINSIIDSGSIEERAHEIWSLGSPSIGSRKLTNDGRAVIHNYLMDQYEELKPDGLEFIGSIRTDVAAPVSLDNLKENEGKRGPAHLVGGDASINLFPIWPNGPMPSLVPESGLSGPLVYCKAGEWEELNGIELKGSIALLNFKGAINLERLFSLGVIAVVVLEDNYMQYDNAAFLFSQTPSPYPRFYAKSDMADQLLALAEGGDSVVTLFGGQVYENRPIESFFFRLPANPTNTFRIPNSFLVDRISAEYRLSSSDILHFNEFPDGHPVAGGVVKIPKTKKEVKVPTDGLWESVAQLFAVSVDALKAANPSLRDSILKEGMTVAIPSGELPLAIIVPIDSVSVVPDLPHGSLMVANLSVALELMEFLSRSTSLKLRRDVIFGFIDGDTLGGQGSRLIAQTLFQLDNDFVNNSAITGVVKAGLDSYRAGIGFFENGNIPDNEGIQAWLVQDWILPRFEEVRIELAENRITKMMELRGHESLPPLEIIEERLESIAVLRDKTILVSGSDANKLKTLYQAWSQEGNTDFSEFGLNREFLKRRFRNELLEEERIVSNRAHNLETGKRLKEVSFSKLSGASNDLVLTYQLDLSDGSRYVGLNLTQKLQLRGAFVGQKMMDVLGPRLRKISAFASVKAGWTEDYTFISDQDRAALPLLETRQTVTYDDFWITGNFLVIPLSGESDRRESLDTPNDTLSKLNWDNFLVQARTTMSILTTSLESLLDSSVQIAKKNLELSRITGATVQFNIRSGIDAKDPVPGTYVFLPMIKTSPGFEKPNTEIFYGYRRGIVQKSLINGSFTMPVAIASYTPEASIYAYHLNRERALFDKVATEGQVGTKPQMNTFKYRPGETVDKNLVMIDAYPRVIYPSLNPSTLTGILGSSYSTNNIDIMDAVTQGAPMDYAIDNPIKDFRETSHLGVCIYMPEGDRIRVAVKVGIDYSFYLSGPIAIAEDGKAVGKGILIGSDRETGDRNLTLELTPYHVAKGMWQLAENRMDLYESYGITSKPLRHALEEAGALIKSAEEAKERADWQKAVGASREAWGILVKNFPKILKLGREAVFSVILLMALAVPGAWFLERLTIGSKGIVARLTGITAIFIAATLFLNIFHPAFKIALSPFIIVIAFTMILMSVIVLALSYSRFDVVLRNFRSSGGDVQSEEISFMSSLGTAFSLGISNLKKRRMRTALTVFTVTALTFSIIGFVAVEGTARLTKHDLPLDPEIGSKSVNPLPPSYDGILIRGHNWRALNDSVISSLSAEFGSDFKVAFRGHYMEVEGGNQANREGVNQIPIKFGDNEGVATAISAFQPAEKNLSGLNQAVTAGNWFMAGNPAEEILPDRYSIILPDEIAKRLGITEEMIIDDQGKVLPDNKLPRVQMMNFRWKVIGILNTELANRIRDINGKSLSIVDYLKSGMSTQTSPGQIVSEGPSYHLDWENLVIVPFAARRDLGIEARSVAIKIPETVNPQHLFDKLALRLKTEFFASFDGKPSMVVPREKIDFAGLAKIFLPVLLCVLIVMNTMLGTVEERKGEVSMLGAIGLSPKQIAFLMFAESTVFSVLGILFGVFGGLLFANIVNMVNSNGGNFLTSLSFNFTSLVSMALAMGTGLVVLLATLIPANKAAALAAPSGMTEWELPENDNPGEIDFDLPFTLTRGNAVGMAAFFSQFLENHNEPTSEDFNCRKVHLSTGDKAGKPYLQMKTDMWLAPYDLDVAQHFSLRLIEGSRAGVFGVTLNLQRFSGSEENGQRTAYNLLNLIRRQFLLWRNLSPERRTKFIEAGALLLAQNEKESLSQ